MYAAIVSAAAALLAYSVYRQRHENQRLLRRLENAAGELERLQVAFSRFAPEDVIERIIAEGSADRGEKREVTVLFADLVGFTTISEHIEPDRLVRLMNGYFERMSVAIGDHRGYVSTFLGDGILAFFGATEPNPWQGNDAVQAALAMRAALVSYNAELAAEGLPPLAAGIGLHRGEGVVGLVGSRELKAFSFVGRTVNIAARVEELTRRFDADIILTEALQETIDPAFRLEALPETEIRGLDQALRLFALEPAGG